MNYSIASDEERQLFLRRVFELHFKEKKDSYEIAEELNCSWGSVVVAIRRLQYMIKFKKKNQQINKQLRKPVP